MTRDTWTEFRERPTNDGATGMTTSDYHEVLSSQRRRVALRVLADTDSTTTLEALAAEVASYEGDRDPDRVALTLHHNHLPRMDQLSLLDYDADANLVTANQLPRP